MIVSPVIFSKINNNINNIYSHSASSKPAISGTTQQRSSDFTGLKSPVDFNLNLLKESLPQKIKMLEPIVDEAEYADIITEILKYTYIAGNFLKNVVNMQGYESIPDEFIGVVPYCGTGDISNQINSWLTGRKFSFSQYLPDSKMVNLIRALEYSLKKIDEKYGTYNGIVYRVGYFNPDTDKQFYSSSKNLDCTLMHVKNKAPSSKSVYSIIKLKNGHDIDAFQRDTNSKLSRELASAEEEVLIDRNSNFRKIPPKEYTLEDMKNILNVINKSMNTNLTIEDLPSISEHIDVLNYISVWEEI